MLKLHKGRPSAVPVILGGGAVAFVRPATAFEIDLALAGTEKLVAGLVEGEESAMLATSLLGEEFQSADFTTRRWIDAASQRIALLELANLCTQSWNGIADDAGEPISSPTRETLAILLRDNEIAMRFNKAIKSKVHEEIAEGEELPVSQDGGAGIQDGAQPAVPTATPAPSGAA